MKKFKLLLLCSLLATAFVGCSDDDTKDPVLPQVSVEAGEAGETTLSFTLTSSDAEAVKYIVLEAGSREVTADLILTNGNVATANTTETITCEGLVDDTTYEIWAAAMNLDGVALSEKVEMTTLKAEEPPVPGKDPILFEADEAYAENLGDGTWALSLMSSKAVLGVVLVGTPGEGEFDSEAETVVLGDDTYYNDFSSGDPVFYGVTGAYLDVVDFGDGDWGVEGELTLEDETPVIFIFEGYVDGLSEGGNTQEPFEVDLTQMLTNWTMQPDMLTGGYQLVATNGDGSIMLLLSLNGVTAEVPYAFAGNAFLTGYDQAELDAWLLDFGFLQEGESWPYWINVSNSGLIADGGYYFFLPHIADSYLNIYAEDPMVDNFSVNFYLLAEDDAEAPFLFYADYDGPLFGAGGGGEEELKRTERTVSYKEVKITQDGNNIECLFSDFQSSCRLYLTAADGVLATADDWATYSVADGSLSTDSYYREYVEEEVSYMFRSGSVYVLKLENGYRFSFEVEAVTDEWLMTIGGTCDTSEKVDEAQPWEYTVASEGMTFSTELTSTGFFALFEDSGIKVGLDFVDAGVVQYQSLPGSGFYPAGATADIWTVSGLADMLEDNFGTYVNTANSYVVYDNKTYTLGEFNPATFDNIIGLQSGGTQVMLGSMMGGSARLTTSDSIGTIYFGYMGEANLKQPEPSEPAEPITVTFTGVNAMTTPTGDGYYMTIVDDAGNMVGLHFVDQAVVTEGFPGTGYYALAASADDAGLASFVTIMELPATTYISTGDSYYLSAADGKEYKFASADFETFATGIVMVQSGMPSTDICILSDMSMFSAPILNFADGAGKLVLNYQQLPFNFGDGVGGLM